MDTPQITDIFHFDNTYKSLPPLFYKEIRPAKVPSPDLIVLNEDLMGNLQLNPTEDKLWASILSGQSLPVGSFPLAQAYAGHQFGYFTMLGDGRAILLGEHVTNSGERFDIQLKGSGKTPYSRNGDGRATLKSMLREYLFSEAIYHLGIPTSRSLAVVKTGEKVYREAINEGAVLTRIMTSHLRIGTFEFARYFGTIEDLQRLLEYTLHRHYPELKTENNPALSLLDRVMNKQIDLIIQWMRVGFIHGVMNTDNTSIFGETFDYGPCAFMNTFHPDTVFSSIDHGGRYSFGNQPKIIKWNLAKLAESLLPLVDSKEDRAITLAVDTINKFDEIFTSRWHQMMANKLGIAHPTSQDYHLVDELLHSMRVEKTDYTNIFNALRQESIHENHPFSNGLLGEWHKKWKERIGNTQNDWENATRLMRRSNPVFIPRNIHVENALNLAVQGDFSIWSALFKAIKAPYDDHEELKKFQSFETSYDQKYQTFCGT
ncbi:MAG TPA: YdiU family protein [Saprospiraceae bacterium]|nr:YdiU family protein [Saprospiraceae bacterium]